MTEQTLPPGTYTLTGPNNEVIFKGGLNAAMEFLPDTIARRNAVHDMYRVEAHKKDAEAQLAKAQAQALQLAHVANDLITRCEAYVSNCEARELEARDCEASKAEAKAEAAERERLAAIANALKPIIGPDGEPTATPDDGDLEAAKSPVDPERFNPEHEPVETDDQEPVKPILSYANTPMSYIKKKDEELPPGHDPQPFDPASPGEIDIPSPGPEPGSRLYQHPPQVAQPVSVSLNEE
jgi:hypothetical protein